MNNGLEHTRLVNQQLRQGLHVEVGGEVMASLHHSNELVVVVPLTLIPALINGDGCRKCFNPKELKTLLELAIAKGLCREIYIHSSSVW